MKRLTSFLTAILAVALMTGTSFAGGIDHGSWDEFTALANGTGSFGYNLAGGNVLAGNSEARGLVDNVVTLNYETGEINYGIAGQTVRPIETIEEHYGIAPAWSESEGMIGAIIKDYEVTPEMERYL